jgi:hypothetical protein
MCYEFESDYVVRRAEEARKELERQKAERAKKEQREKQPAAKPGVKDGEPVPV